MRYEEIEVDPKTECGEKRGNDEKKCSKGHLPPMNIHCNLEVAIENKNKIIYVYPGKLQYFTAYAIGCSGGEEIEIEYCGCHTKWICDEVIICGCLGYYKIVKSGIIFIPRHKLSEMHDDWFPTDILSFKAKEKCSKDVKEIRFDVVFTYSKYAYCNCGCNNNCKS
jgi:hypothetical protein